MKAARWTISPGARSCLVGAARSVSACKLRPWRRRRRASQPCALIGLHHSLSAKRIAATGLRGGHGQKRSLRLAPNLNSGPRRVGLEVTLPELDGLSLLKALRPIKATPVLLLSAAATWPRGSERRQAARPAGWHPDQPDCT